MDLISHILFGIILYQAVDPFLILGTVLPDVDKAWTYPKRRIRGANSRTVLTELPLMPLIAIAGFFFSPAFSLGVVSHLVLDFITGETRPFNPFSTETVDFNWSLKTKLVLAGVLWTSGIYLIASGTV
jgi:membrane-bound metal-dependent hydrolase YbcI (DUF457 family)